MGDFARPIGARISRPVRAFVATILLIGALILGCGPIGSATSSPDADPTFDPDAGRADWWVSRADLPLSPDARVIHGLLEERSCASGMSPDGRILGPIIEYRPDAIIVTYKVREKGGTCQGNPHFAITIQLTEALGTRGLFDGGLTPPRDATVDPTVVVAPDEDCGPLMGTSDTKIACIALVNASLGDRYTEFASVRVAPAAADCPGDTCTERAAIEARTWIVQASALDGTSFTWTCTYRDEVATCSAGPG